MNKRRAIRNAYREACRHTNRAEFLRIARAEIHADFWHLFDETHPDYAKRFTFGRGGRGGGRSTNISKALVHLAMDNKMRFVCGRSYQNSIEESCKNDILEQIETLGLSSYFDNRARDGSITCLATGAKFIFKGFERADKSIKSMSAIDILWWEEADGAVASMLDKIEPTIRKKGSRLVFSWNPTDENAAIEKFRLINLDHALGAVERNTHYFNNPWCPPSLIAGAELLKAKDYEKYLHVYEGHYYIASQRSILGKLVKKRTFVIDKTYGDPLIGIDWGFSNDPTAIVECYIKGRDLYIRRAASKVGLGLTDTPLWLIKHAPNILRYTSRADSARPETIHLCQQQIRLMKGAKKEKGSVETGISFLQSFDNIYIHPDCQPDTASELIAYQWKTDKYEEITAIPEDANNHYADAIRYGLEPAIRVTGGFAVA